MIFFNQLDPLYYPAPLSVAMNTLTLLVHGDLLSNTISSLYRLSIAALVAIPTAIALATITSTVKWFDELFEPIIAFTFPLPKVAIYPLLLLIFGIDQKSKIALIAIGIFYLVFINTRLGMKKLLASQINDIVLVYKLSRWNYFVNYLVKGSQLDILTGIKIALNYALTLVIVSEATVSNNGIGYFIWRSWDQFNILNVYSSVLLLCLIGYVSYFLFEKYIAHCRRKIS